MKTATYFLIFVFSFTTAIMGVKSARFPITVIEIGFIVWAISPYAYLAGATALVSTRASIAAVFALSLLAGSFGVWQIVGATFIHLDPQGALIFLFTPLWQWVFLVLTALPLYFLNRMKRRGKPEINV